MGQQPRPAPSVTPRDGSGSPVPVMDSATLMGDRRELIIRHGLESYRLRITASNKLILTK